MGDKLNLANGVIVEVMDEDVVVLIPGSSQVLRLSGDLAEAVLLLQSGRDVSLPAGVSQQLLQLGVAIREATPSRRSVLKAGGIGLGTGIALVALPGVAAASSGEDSPATCETGTGVDEDRVSVFVKDGGLRVYVAVDDLVSETIVAASTLRLVAAGQAYTSGEAKVTGPFNSYDFDIEWFIPGLVLENNVEVCANYTLTFDAGSPVKYRVDALVDTEED